MEALLTRKLPGHSDQREERPQVVDNPYASLPDPARDPRLPAEAKTMVVTVNVRATPIELLFDRGYLDSRLRKAADIFRGLCEALQRGGGVIDPARIRVDVSGQQFSITEAAIKAAKTLARIQGILGVPDFSLLCVACTVGRSYDDIAAKIYGNPSARDRLYIGRRLKDSLNAVADALGLGGGPRKDDRGKQRFYRAFSKLELTADHRDWSEPPAEAERRAAHKQDRRKKR